MADTVRDDLRNELDFLERHDRAIVACRAIVDMPDRKLRDFIQLCSENGGRLSKAKRPRFRELTEGEIERLEEAVQKAMGSCCVGP